MKVIQENDHAVLFRFAKGEHFPQVFQAWLEKQKIKGAFFYGLGGATIIRCGFYDLEGKAYHFKEFSGEHFEILGITGNVAVFKEGLKVHAHLSFSNNNLKSFGGHLDWLEVGGTLEILLQPLKPLKRKEDRDTGIALLESY